ncbi:MAG: ABC transporter permease [Thermoleophilaceae bacterium]
MTLAGLLVGVRAVVALGRRSVRQTFRKPQFLAPIFVFPTLVLAVNTGAAGAGREIPGFPQVAGFLDFELAGGMIQATMLAGVSGGIALAADIEMGFTDRLITAPIPRSAIVLGRLAATAVLGALVGAWFVLVGLVFGAEVQAGPLGVLVVLVLVFLAAAVFGGLTAAIALKSGRQSSVQGIFPLTFVLVFLSSAFFPRALLVEPARTIADYNPMSYIVEGFREPVVAQLTLETLLACLAGIAVLGALGAVLSALALRSRLRNG